MGYLFVADRTKIYTNKNRIKLKINRGIILVNMQDKIRVDWLKIS